MEQERSPQEVNAENPLSTFFEGYKSVVTDALEMSFVSESIKRECIATVNKFIAQTKNPEDVDRYMPFFDKQGVMHKPIQNGEFSIPMAVEVLCGEHYLGSDLGAYRFSNDTMENWGERKKILSYIKEELLKNAQES